MALVLHWPPSEILALEWPEVERWSRAVQRLRGIEEG
jgi:hypothetical protein